MTASSSGPGTIAMPARAALSRPPVSTLLPLAGLLIAMAVIVSRRPDAVIHPQFWAEDGRIYYQDVYNLGILRTILKPQSGYYQTYPVVVAWLARFAALPDAPYVTDWISLVVQALPVALLFSRRAETISPDLRIRALIAFVYLVIPNETELDATAVNQQWTLAISALIVLVSAPPVRPAWRAIDYAILLACGLTGPFSIILAVVAWLVRWRRGGQAVPLPATILLTLCGILQLIAIEVISRHVGGVSVEPRPNPQLFASASLFARLVGGRVLLGAVIGEKAGMTAPAWLQWLALAGGVVVVGFLAVSRRVALQMMVVLGGGVLIAALVSPSVPSPAWPILAALPPNVQRYFFLAQMSVVLMLVWIAVCARFTALRAGAAAAVVSALVFAVIHWTYPPAGTSPFPAQAQAFEHARVGTTSTLTTVPTGWTITLLKR